MIVCLLGYSGSGKETLANEAEEVFGIKRLPIYSTNPKYKEHINKGKNQICYVTELQVSELKGDGVIHNIKDEDGYECFTTLDMVKNKNSVYICTPQEFINLKENFKELKTLSFYLDVPKEICRARLRNRGFSDEKIEEMIKKDEQDYANFKAAKDVDYKLNAWNLESVVKRSYISILEFTKLGRNMIEK